MKIKQLGIENPAMMYVIHYTYGPIISPKKIHHLCNR